MEAVDGPDTELIADDEVSADFPTFFDFADAAGPDVFFADMKILEVRDDKKGAANQWGFARAFDGQIRYLLPKDDPVWIRHHQYA